MGGAIFELGNFAERVQLRIGQHIGRRLAETERHKNHPVRHIVIGAQGGDAIATVKAGLRQKNTATGSETTGPIIVSSSRAILYASKGQDFTAAARKVAMQTRETLQLAREA